MISKKELKHLSELARIEVPRAEEEKLLKDLGEILNYFEVLKEINTEKVEPMTGGTFSKNVLRENSLSEERLPAEPAVQQFPEKQGGFLKTPPVFE